MGLLKQEVKARHDPWMNSVHFRARGLMNLQGQCCSVPLCPYERLYPSVRVYGGGWCWKGRRVWRFWIIMKIRSFTAGFKLNLGWQLMNRSSEVLIGQRWFDSRVVKFCTFVPQLTHRADSSICLRGTAGASIFNALPLGGRLNKAKTKHI